MRPSWKMSVQKFIMSHGVIVVLADPVRHSGGHLPLRLCHVYGDDFRMVTTAVPLARIPRPASRRRPMTCPRLWILGTAWMICLAQSSRMDPGISWALFSAALKSHACLRAWELVEVASQVLPRVVEDHVVKIDDTGTAA